MRLELGYYPQDRLKREFFLQLLLNRKKKEEKENQNMKLRNLIRKNR